MRRRPHHPNSQLCAAEALMRGEAAADEIWQVMGRPVGQSPEWMATWRRNNDPVPRWKREARGMVWC